MTTNPVAATSPLLPMSTAQGKPAAADADNSLGQDAFLKLLVAQLKYQDPMNPADGADFMAQTAQFTMVEKLSQMQKQGDQTIASQQHMQAISMVGKTVSYEDATGVTKTGVVDSVRFSGDGQTLMINGTSVNLSSVSEVSRDRSQPALADDPAVLSSTIVEAVSAAIRQAMLADATLNSTSTSSSSASTSTSTSTVTPVTETSTASDASVAETAPTPTTTVDSVESTATTNDSTVVDATAASGTASGGG